MARVAMRMNAVETSASRVALFAVLCRAVDALAALPDEIRESHATIFQDAFALGWRETCAVVPSSQKILQGGVQNSSNFSESQ